MNYLSVENLSKSYGNKVLFDKISFGISRGQKMALVAKNGAGKTTLLKIIAGQDTPDGGQITLRKEISKAYLEQEPKLDDNLTVLEAVLASDNPITRVIQEYEHAITLVETQHSPANDERLQDAMSQMDMHNAWDYEQKIKQILSRLKITDLEQKVASLSGGQRKRVALSKILIAEPDLVIMDEPTNHLDLEMIEWLEGYLMNKDLTLLIVTHDRYFLDRVATEIVEIDGGKIYQYAGNFSYFVEKKAEREIMENSELDKAKNLYKRELEWVRKMPRARGTKAKSRVDAFDDVKKKATGKKNEDALQLTVKMTRMGGKILELIKLGKSFGDKKILENFSYVFKKGEKIGIMGPNGVGKSTFLNIIQGLEQADTGKIQTGETIVFGYYSQKGMKMREDKRVIEVVKDIAEFIPLADGSKLSVSQLLLRFQFSGDMQYSFVSKLSGGEKRRLYLLTVLIKNPNFLILDEPTNDLDILTLSVLEDFLQSFGGCMLIVTHDRYFMDKLIDHLFVFEGEGYIKDFPGTYSEYTVWREEQQRELKAGNTPAKAEEKVVVESKQDFPPANGPRKASFKEKFEFEQLAKELKELEEEKNKLTEIFNISSQPHDELLKSGERLGKVISEIEEKSLRWLELSELS
ncbi:MAG: ABC-F family ATP-binding cassette domain-containing protein [Bacteroidetes bacterium]|nr:ABC-F family ATP-binding cassette domain-containing protein [Bacteroidota bacterium]